MSSVDPATGLTILEADGSDPDDVPDWFNRLNTRLKAAWTAYTPAVTTDPASSSITIGNGTIRGRVNRLGSTVFFGVTIIGGTTTVIPGNTTHALRISLPFDPNTTNMAWDWPCRVKKTDGSLLVSLAHVGAAESLAAILVPTSSGDAIEANAGVYDVLSNRGGLKETAGDDWSSFRLSFAGTYETDET